MIYIQTDQLTSKLVIASPTLKGVCNNFILTGADGSMLTSECMDVSESKMVYELTPLNAAGFDFSNLPVGEYTMTLRYDRTELATLTASLSKADSIDIYYDEEKKVNRIPSYNIAYDDLIGKPTFKTINGEAITGNGDIEISGVNPEGVQEIIDQNTNGFQTADQVNQAIEANLADKNFQSADQVNQAIEANLADKNFQSADQVNQAIETNLADKNFQSADQVNQTVDTKLTPYNPTENFKTVGGETIIGTGDIKVSTDMEVVTIDKTFTNQEFVDEGLSGVYFELNIEPNKYYKVNINYDFARTTKSRITIGYNTLDKGSAVVQVNLNPSYTQNDIQTFFECIDLRLRDDIFYNCNERYEIITTKERNNVCIFDITDHVVSLRPTNIYTVEDLAQKLGTKENWKILTIEKRASFDFAKDWKFSYIQLPITEVDHRISIIAAPELYTNYVSRFIFTAGPELTNLHFFTNKFDEEIEPIDENIPVTPGTKYYIEFQFHVEEREKTKWVCDGYSILPINNSINPEQVQEIINQNTNGFAKSAELSTVATTGSYNDLSDKPTIPEGVVVDQTLDSQSTNAVANKPVTEGLAQRNIKSIPKTVLDQPYEPQQNIQADWDQEDIGAPSYIKNKPTIPTDNNQLSNGAGYITESEVTSKDYATNTRVNDVENIANSKTTIAEVESKGYETTSEVDRKLGEYNPNSNFKTINNESIIGIGNIEISGGEDLSNIEHFTPSYDGTWVYVNEYQGKNCIIDFPDLSNNGSIFFFFGDSRYTCYFKIPETWNGGEAEDRMNPEKTTGPTQFIKNVWYKVENYPTYRTIDIMSENPNGGFSEDRVNQLIDERGYQISANIKTVNGQSLTDGPGNINIKEGYPNFEYRPNAELRLKHHPDFGEGFVTYDGVEEGKTYNLILDDYSLIRENMTLVPPRDGVNHRAIIEFRQINPEGNIKRYQVYDACGPDPILYPGNVYIMDQVDSTNRVYASTVKTSDMTEERVNQIVTSKDYQTSSQVDQIVTSKDYQTYSQVEEIIGSRGYMTEGQVNQIVTSKDYQTYNQVEAIANNKVTGQLSETWEFELEDGSTIQKNVVLK